MISDQIALHSVQLPLMYLHVTARLQLINCFKRHTSHELYFNTQFQLPSFLRAVKYNFNVQLIKAGSASENTRDISISRRTNPLICLLLFSFARKQSISTRKTNMFVFFMLTLMLMRLCLVCASENSIRQISGFVLLLILMLMSRMFSLSNLILCLFFCLCLCVSENWPLQTQCSQVIQTEAQKL